jgi:hypothetical protein
MATRQTFFCIALTALCGAGAVGVRADDPAVRHAIEAAHVQQVRADTSGDAAQWRQVYQNVDTPDFTYTFPNGHKESREQSQEHQLRFVSFLKETHGVMQDAYHIQRVTRTGNRATEEGFETYSLSFADTTGRVGPKGKKHLVTGRNTYRAGWAKVGASWRLADFHLLKHEERTDGKPSGV